MKKIILIMAMFCVALMSNAQTKLGDDSDGVAKAKGSKKYDFKITYVNGDVREVTSSIDINFCMRTMFLEDKENEEAIYPAETKFVEVTNKDGITLKGLPQDSMWVFTMNEGALKLLSTLPETKIKFAEWIQVDGGDLLPYNMVEIEKAVVDNERAAKYIKKYNTRIKIGKVFGYYLTPALVVAGILSGPFVTIAEVSVSYFHFGAVGMFPIGVLYKYSANKQVEKAIEAYNEK